MEERGGRRGGRVGEGGGGGEIEPVEGGKGPDEICLRKKGSP